MVLDIHLKRFIPNILKNNAKPKIGGLAIKFGIDVFSHIHGSKMFGLGSSAPNR